MDRRSFLAGAAGAVAGLAGCRSQHGTTTTAVTGLPRLHVDGRWLVDPDGRHVTLRGVNLVDPWWGTEYADLRAKGYWQTFDLATDAEQGWYTDIVRLPIEPRSINEVGVSTVLEKYVDRAVDRAREQGVYLLIDYHAVERYDTAAIDERIRNFWKKTAPRYASEPHVLYELFNEPTEPAGQGLESWRTWREYASPWVELIRDHAPETPVLVGSPRWSSLVKFAPQAPFEQDNIVYTAHLFPSWGPRTWEETFGNAAFSVPMMITEWGYTNADSEQVEPHMRGTTKGWGRPFRRWLAAHTNVGWCSWVFDSHWRPRMFDAKWHLLGGNAHHGVLVKQWLAETRDEQTPGATPTPAENTPPEPPTALDVQASGATTATVTFEGATDPDGDLIAQYRVTVGDRDVRLLRGARREFTIQDLTPGQRYEVQVVAVDEHGARSEPATVHVRLERQTEPVATIPRVANPPTIDGEIDEVWLDAPVHDVEHVLLGSPEEADLSAEWRALWNESALYCLLTVTDDDAHTDSAEAYRDDTAELYLDLDHSRSGSYDGENDLQLIFPRGTSTALRGANSAPIADSVAVATVETDKGYRVEVAVPFGAYDVTPSAGDLIGMDVHATDDEDGGDRDLKRGWYATSDVSWQNPQAFAPVELGE